MIQLVEENKEKGSSKVENQQREKIEKLQDQLNAKLRKIASFITTK